MMLPEYVCYCWRQIVPQNSVFSQNRLMNAAKKAVTKMPIRTLKPDDDVIVAK